MDSDTPQSGKARRVMPAPTLSFVGSASDLSPIRLEEDDGTFGRREDNAYVVAHPSISRVHARFVKQAGSIIVTDLGSAGGTRVNGEEIAGPHVLAHGDEVRFGSVACRFEDPVAASSGEETTMVIEAPKVSIGPQLSPRQQQVLELIAEGMTNKEIGGELGITERTVKAYAQEVYERLGVPNRAGAVAEAVRNGLLPGVR